MYHLQRITSEYVEAEDRIRLSGEDEQGNSIVLWLTQRLLAQLISHLLALIEEQAPDIAKNSNAADTTQSLMQGFAQQAAQADLAPELPVETAANSQSWLVQEVDIALSAEGALVLVFKREIGAGTAIQDEELETPECDNAKAILTVEAKQLRQWLGIIQAQWQRAGWPLTLWPGWMDATSVQSSSSNIPLH